MTVEIMFIMITIIALICIASVIIWDRLRSKKESQLIDTLQEENKTLNKTNLDLLSSVQRTQQAQADQLAEMSNQILEVSGKMTSLQINLQSIIDEKMEKQSKEFKTDLDRVNSKVDTILGMVMECENENCPTRKKVSRYLKENRYDN